MGAVTFLRSPWPCTYEIDPLTIRASAALNPRPSNATFLSSYPSKLAQSSLLVGLRLVIVVFSNGEAAWGNAP